MKMPVKLPVAASACRILRIAPWSLCHTEGRKPCAEATTVDATRARKTLISRRMVFPRLAFMQMRNPPESLGIQLFGMQLLTHARVGKGAARYAARYLPDMCPICHTA